MPPIITLRDVHVCEQGPEYHVPEHYHNAYQIYIVVNGAVEATSGPLGATLKEYQGMLVPPGEPRSRASADGRSVRYFMSIFDNRRLDLSTLEGRIFSVPRALRPDLEALCDEALSPGTPNTTELTEALLIRLLIGLVREQAGKASQCTALGAAGRSSSSQSNQALQELVVRAEAFMRQNLASPISQKDIAAALHLSVQHLARLFREGAGRPLGERLIELRLEKAKELLLQSSLPITQISLQVGYGSFSHFTQTFRKKVGVSPSQYRQGGGRRWQQGAGCSQ